MSYISPRAHIESGVYIGQEVTIHAGVTLKRGAIIEDYCTIGKPSRVQLTAFRQRLKDATGQLGIADYDAVVDTETIIGEDATVQSHSMIFSGVRLAEGVTCEDNSTIRWDTSIGPYSKIMINGFVGSYIEIGEYCRVSGIVGNSSKIGNYVTTRGSLTHTYKQYGGGKIVPAPILEDYATVGRDSTVIGGVTIGQYAFVAAGAIVSKDIPARTLVRGVNEMTPFAQWDGATEYLASLPTKQ
jgi:acetyltransferase-like isoleucine patch superfamily enzyme